MKAIKDYQIVRHGIDHSQYFQGCGVAFTDFDDCVTGCGFTESEAFDDALEQLAMGDYEVQPIEAPDDFSDVTACDDCEYKQAIDDDEDDDGACDGCELYWYVSIRVK